MEWIIPQHNNSLPLYWYISHSKHLCKTICIIRLLYIWTVNKKNIMIMQPYREFGDQMSFTDSWIHYVYYIFFKSRTRETKHLLTDADSRTNTKKKPSSKAKKKYMLRGNFSSLINKSFQIWNHFYPLVFSKDSENKNKKFGNLTLGSGAKRGLNVVNK